MDSELDVGKMVAAFVQANIEHAVSFASGRVKTARDVIRSKLDRTYREYLTRLLDRYSKGKSFFVRSEPTPLYQFFVPLDLRTQRRVLHKPSAVDVMSVAHRAIVSGSAGSGKTMLMRHLLISTIASRVKTPVFLELRQFNQKSESLRGALLRILTTNGLDVDEAYLKLALKSGHFSVMLDGFDELELAKRDSIAREVQEFAEEYPDIWIVLSSRPDSDLEGWGTFTEFRVDPLDLERAVELVAKLPFDDPVKHKFIGDLKASLFDLHRSFLSNPLLLSIMLLTYSDVAHIPSKLSIFYNQAFESLFQKHDALKAGFQRERRSGLDIQDFAKAFAAFSLQSYDKREFSFSRSRALDLFESGQRLSQLDYKPDALLADSLQAVCLLVEEGVNITFAHRSFQEYFVARFIVACPPASKRRLIERFATGTRGDSVISLLHELDSHNVELYYVLPAIRLLRKRVGVKRKVGKAQHLRYLRMMFESFSYRDGEDAGLSSVIAENFLFNAVLFIFEEYCGGFTRIADEARKVSAERLKKAFKQEFGGTETIEASSLSGASPFVKAAMESSGAWGAEFLENVLAQEQVIIRKHKETHDSLDKILS